MTHDELLAKVNALDYVLGTEPSGDIAVLALRAIVELHKPFDIPEKYKNKDSTLKQGLACYLCSTEMYFSYPCPTIQAIEKELG